MVPINEKPLLYAMMVVMGVSTLFCFIGLVTPGWGLFFRPDVTDVKPFVFSIFVPSATGPLTIISLLLLIACMVGLLLVFLNKLQQPYVPVGIVVLMITTSFLLLSTFASFFSVGQASLTSAIPVYSIHLMITAFTFTYLASIIGTYWITTMRRGLPNVKTTSADRRAKVEEHDNNSVDNF
jgi:hypothetical protein